MSTWVNKKIKDLTVKVGSGATPRGGQQVYLDEGEVTLIRSQNVYDYEFKKEGLVYITDDAAEKLNNVALEENDILLNITGDSVGRCCIVPKGVLPARVNQHVAIIRTNSDFNSKFLMYYLNDSRNKEKLLNHVHGGTRKALTKGIIEDFEILVPPLEVQDRIVDILWTIDSKIEANKKMNQTLEEMVLTLYKHWFVNFAPFKEGDFVDSEIGMIPKGWEVRPLNDLIESTLGGDWGKEIPSKDFTEEVYCVRGADIPKLAIGERGEVPVRYIKENSLGKRKLIKGDIVVEKSGGSPTQSTGRAFLVNDEIINRFKNDIVYTNFCVRFRLKDLDYQHMVFQEIVRLYKDDIFFNYENGTTGIKNLDIQGMLEGQYIVIPDKKTISNFNKKIEKIRAMIQVHGLENEYLVEVREYLLPKFLSGEIDLSEAEIEMENVLLKEGE